MAPQAIPRSPNTALRSRLGTGPAGRRTADRMNARWLALANRAARYAGLIEKGQDVPETDPRCLPGPAEDTLNAVASGSLGADPKVKAAARAAVDRLAAARKARAKRGGSKGSA